MAIQSLKTSEIRKKFQPFVLVLDILGSRMDEQGIHMQSDKMEKIRNWQEPVDHTGVLRFLGLIGYRSIFMPNVGSYTGPLQTICVNKQQFRWTPLHQKCFDEIKHLACRTPILKPIQWNPPENLSNKERTKLKVWVITDTCPAGIGTLIGQGEEWQTCQPAAFMSKKFTNTQCRYFAYELKALGILKALMRWQDDLMGGREFTVIMDHKALEYFKAKNHNSGRHLRWQAFVTSFNCEIKYMEGCKNEVADALSHYYNSSTDEDLHFDDYVSVDIHLDKNAVDIIPNRVEEYEELLAHSRLREASENRRLATLCARNSRMENVSETTPDKGLGGRTGMSTALETTPDESLGGRTENLKEILPPEEELQRQFEENDLIEAIKSGYKNHWMYEEILGNPRNFPNFSIENGLITRSGNGEQRPVVAPEGTYERKSIRGIILKNIHEMLGHLGPKKTTEYLCHYFLFISETTDTE